MRVRVIEFTVAVTADDGSTRTAWYRLITTLLDHRRYPAAALAAAYARRWSVETGFAELKTALRGPGRLLRGRTPELARQELWAYLAVYQALRTLIARAAARDGIDPGQISFTAARDAAELTLGTSPAALGQALAGAETEMLKALVPLRPGRIWPRAVKKPRSPYPSRGSRPGPLAQHGTCTVAVPAPRRTTENTTDQARQPAQHTASPP
jgi:hypothetical protein